MKTVAKPSSKSPQGLHAFYSSATPWLSNEYPEVPRFDVEFLNGKRPEMQLRRTEMAMAVHSDLCAFASKSQQELLAWVAALAGQSPKGSKIELVVTSEITKTGAFEMHVKPAKGSLNWIPGWLWAGPKMFVDACNVRFPMEDMLTNPRLVLADYLQWHRAKIICYFSQEALAVLNELPGVTVKVVSFPVVTYDRDLEIKSAREVVLGCLTAEAYRYERASAHLLLDMTDKNPEIWASSVCQVRDADFLLRMWHAQWGPQASMIENLHRTVKFKTRNIQALNACRRFAGDYARLKAVRAEYGKAKAFVDEAKKIIW